MNMEIDHVYTKARRAFGRQLFLTDRAAVVNCDIQPDGELNNEFVVVNPREVGIQCAPEMSVHEVGTEERETKNHGVLHEEGGWPATVDYTDKEMTKRYRRHEEKNEQFISAMRQLGDSTEKYLRQNISVDIYEEFFSDGYGEMASESPSAKNIAFFRDPNEIPRTACTISWEPESTRKLAVAYCIMEFQQMPMGVSLSSYIWDIDNTNYPDKELIPPSPLCCLEYNPKDPTQLVGGGYNGVVCWFDTRKGAKPVHHSAIEKSHQDPVYKALWVKSNANEFLSVSTDGNVFYWDTRKLSEPVSTLQLNPLGNDAILGGVTVDYDASLPHRFLVGTEQGQALLCNMRAKTPQDIIERQYAGHHGPVYAVQRKPGFSKYFLTVGDWTARIWHEDLPEAPIITTRYDSTYLTDGCWSPTRPGVFFTSKLDGTLDVWDYLYKQNEPILPIPKVSGSGLHCLRVTNDGQYVACGGKDGSTTVYELCSSLYKPQPNELQSIRSMFEREVKREKNLRERRQKEAYSRQRRQESSSSSTKKEDVPESVLKAVEDEFWEIVRSEGQNEEGMNAGETEHSSSSAGTLNTQGSGGSNNSDGEDVQIE